MGKTAHVLDEGRKHLMRQPCLPGAAIDLKGGEVSGTGGLVVVHLGSI
jgi:hypothetical protein